MKSLVSDIDNFESTTHELHEIGVNDLLDPELTQDLLEFYKKHPSKRSEKEKDEIISIQASLLTQIDLFRDEEDQDPRTLAFLVPKEQKGDKKNAKRGRPTKTLSQP